MTVWGLRFEAQAWHPKKTILRFSGPRSEAEECRIMPRELRCQDESLEDGVVNANSSAGDGYERH